MDTFAELKGQLTAIQSLNDVNGLKKYVQTTHEWLRHEFTHRPIREIIEGRATLIDDLLQHLWQLSGLNEAKRCKLSLVAVGGYGRGQLQPFSDIDLLIVSQKRLSDEVAQTVSHFITALWDAKLDVGQAVRTIDDCVKLAKEDITIATNLVEARYLIGHEDTFNKLMTKTGPRKIWKGAEFFQAKYQEQLARHAKFNGTTFNLEPNVKENPGCLRDIQSIGWVAKQHFQEFDGEALVRRGYFTNNELTELVECRDELWRLRCALHFVAGRSENRLLFDYQPDVAELLNFGTGKSSVEKMMKGFFRVTRRVTELNQMLLQRFQVDILGYCEKNCVIINEHFATSNGKVIARHERVFGSPEAIFQFLLMLAEHPEINELDTECIRQLRNARRYFADQFWLERAACRKLFMQCMRKVEFFAFPWDVMHLHGILQAYLPQWDGIVGLMQFDLFHAYTVDEHTHRLVKNMYRYFSSNNQDFPRCHTIVKEMDRPEILFLAAIFHDIAKGRNGDHSTLGAADALAFCEKHGLSSRDSQMIAWLVDSHLLMSVVAQRRDIYDPEVVAEFAGAMKTTEHLHLLYCLTLADIRATNDSLWNDWKSNLLRELFLMTHKALDNGLQCQQTIADKARDNRHAAEAILEAQGISAALINAIWTRLGDNHFARFRAAQIAWHTEEIIDFHKHNSDDNAFEIALSNVTTKAGSELLLYGRDRPAIFAQIASVIDSLHLNILDAHISVTDDGYVFDTFIIVDDDGEQITDQRRQQQLISSIQVQLAQPGINHKNTRKQSRIHKTLDVPVKVRFFSTAEDATLIELEALDQPGLLARIGHVFTEANVTLKLAKIATIGERAEDVFIIADEHNHALSAEMQVALKHKLCQRIEQLETE